MSFPRYPAYKDSGVEWLGEVPEHWEALPLRRLIREVTSGTSVNAIDEPASPGQAGVLKTSCVYTGEFRPEENKAILESELYRATCTVVAGSLVVSRMNTPDLVGAAGLVKNDDPFLFLPDRLWLVSFQDCDPQFMNYWCKSISYRSQVQLACSGTSSSMQNLSQDNFYSFIAPLPPTGEQSAIATFLDRETAKIDALIAEQQRLIELLQEKRQAVISHAVTKGLNPGAPMKDSGVEWLGEVPEHWQVKQLRYVCKIQTGSRDTEEAVEDGEYPFFVRSQQVERIDSCSFDCEAVLTAGDGAGVGKVFHYYVGPFDFHQRVYMLNEFNGIHSKLVYHFLKVNFFKVALQGGAKSTVDSLRRPIFTSFPLCIPPQDEQELLLEFLEAKEQELSDLVRASDQAILLLQERRSALISAAVTGQIDVRGLVPEAVAA